MSYYAPGWLMFGMLIGWPIFNLVVINPIVDWSALLPDGIAGFSLRLLYALAPIFVPPLVWCALSKEQPGCRALA